VRAGWIDAIHPPHRRREPHPRRAHRRAGGGRP
jgi:hypothetical protein